MNEEQARVGPSRNDWASAPPVLGSHDAGSVLLRETGAGLRTWTAIVLAGQRPGVDPLAQHAGETFKACISLCGLPMIVWVVRALGATPSVGRIVVLAQDESALSSADLAAEAGIPVTFASSAEGISTSILQVAGSQAAPWPILVTTADHPLLTRAMLEAFIKGSARHDVTVGAVERRTVLSDYPESKRTWLKFRGEAFSGANLFALNGPAAKRALELWVRAERDRKAALKLFWHFGPMLALRAVTRTIGFDAALQRAGRNLGISAGLVELAWAEAAIDVDKVADLHLVERILSERNRLAMRAEGAGQR